MQRIMNMTEKGGLSEALSRGATDKQYNLMEF